MITWTFFKIIELFKGEVKLPLFTPPSNPTPQDDPG